MRPRAGCWTSSWGAAIRPRCGDWWSRTEGRPYHGSLEGKLFRARQAVWLLEHTGAQNIVCGPRALNAILDYQGVDYDPIRLDQVPGDYIDAGLPLTEVKSFAERMGWESQMARRLDPAAPIPTPAVLHTKESHYVALLERDPASGEYFLEDREWGSRAGCPRRRWSK